MARPRTEAVSRTLKILIARLRLLSCLQALWTARRGCGIWYASADYLIIHANGRLAAVELGCSRGCHNSVMQAGSNPLQEIGDCVLLLEGHSKPITDMATAANGSVVVTASEDATARVWDLVSTFDVCL